MRCKVSLGPIALGILVGCGGGGGPGDAGPGPGGMPPLIGAFTPTAGPVGTTVIIEGLLFGARPEHNTVRFNGVNAAVQSASPTELVAVVPPGATTGRIQVATAGGTGNSGGEFTVLPSSNTPGVAWTTRLSGPVGTLEGLASDGKRLVAVADSIRISTDILRWDQQRNFTRLNEVIWNGKGYLAVGGSNSMYASSTGLTWNPLHGTGDDLHGLASSGDLWVAVGERGTIRTSPDGTTWTTQGSSTTEILRSVAWSGSQFVAVGERGTILTSPDGVTWTARTSGTLATFSAVGAAPSLMVASAEPGDGPSTIYTSPDGVTWTPRARDLGWASAIIHAGGRWLLAGHNRVMHSTDGVSWSASTTGASITGVVYRDGEFVGVGYTGQSVGAVYTSPDADRWTLRASAQAFRAVARAASDGRLVAVGTSDVSLTSTDHGATWQFSTIGSSSGHIFIDLDWSPALGAFIANTQEAANQRIFTSVDGQTWTARGHALYQGALGASPSVLVNVGFNLVGARGGHLHRRGDLDRPPARHAPGAQRRLLDRLAVPGRGQSRPHRHLAGRRDVDRAPERRDREPARRRGVAGAPGGGRRARHHLDLARRCVLDQPHLQQRLWSACRRLDGRGVRRRGRWQRRAFHRRRHLDLPAHALHRRSLWRQSLQPQCHRMERLGQAPGCGGHARPRRHVALISEPPAKAR